MQVQLDEVRRLTGPNLLWDKPGAIVDVFIGYINPQTVVSSWKKWISILLEEFGWEAEQHTHRLHDGGASFAISAPIDSLYTACELAELAWNCCEAELTEQELPDISQKLMALRTELAQEVNPRLLELIDGAKRHNVTCLCDDDDVSLGMGKAVNVWPVGEIPDPTSVDFANYTDIPLALITGTNGKSTSVRLAAHIAKAANINAGVTSTDFIRVGDDIIDKGDYSGPGGARMLLRDPRCEMAFLEVARGGILRRGLPVNKVDAALITNVASDHLGQYGINTVEELAEAKFVVTKALSDNAVIVLNADNELVVAQAFKLDKTICWFAEDEYNVLIQHQIASGGKAVFVCDNVLTYFDGKEFESIAEINSIPMTFNGTARHNIQNALGVVGLCKALQLPLSAIQTGLREFASNAEDNPGRGNLYKVQGCEVIVDFAHNEHSMSAMINMVKTMPARRRVVMFGHAGDRSDQEIRDLTYAVADLNADLFVVSEVEKYLRGRQLGDVPQIVKEALVEHTIDKGRVLIVKSPLEGVRKIIAGSEPGDIILLFVLDQREEVHDWLVSQAE
jgi:UDP-N-acetylmuramyl tripeptide synthase